MLGESTFSLKGVDKLIPRDLHFTSKMNKVGESPPEIWGPHGVK